MNKDDILAEYYRAEIHYKAMSELLKEENITVDDDDTEPSVEPVKPDPIQPEPIQPTPNPEVPEVKEPEIVYIGKTTYTLARSEKLSLSIDFNNVESSKDYIITPYSSPAYTYGISGAKTANGFRVTIDIKTSLMPGQGSFKIYLKNKPDDCLYIYINVK